MSGARISTQNDDVSWFESGTSFARDQEYIMASLALVHYATSNCSESSLMDLMKKIVDISPGYTGQDGDFVPPISWTTTDQASVKRVKELLMMSLPWDSKRHPRGHAQPLHQHHCKDPEQVVLQAVRRHWEQKGRAPPHTLQELKVQENSTSR